MRWFQYNSVIKSKKYNSAYSFLSLAILVLLLIFSTENFVFSQYGEVKLPQKKVSLIEQEITKTLSICDSLAMQINTDSLRFQLTKDAFQKALKLNNNFLACKAASKLANYYLLVGQYDIGIKYLTYLKYYGIKHHYTEIILETLALYSLYYSYNRQPKIAYQYSKKILYIAQQTNNKEYIGSAYLSISNDFGMIRSLDTALAYCDSAITIALETNNKKQFLLANINKFAFLRENGRFKDCEIVSYEIDSIRNDLNYSIYDVYVYEILGTSAFDNQQYLVALQFYQDGLKQAIISNNKQYEFLFYDRISFAYEYLDNIDSAYHYYILFKQLETETVNNEMYKKSIETENSIEKKLKNLEIKNLIVENDRLNQKRKINYLVIGLFLMIIIFLVILSIVFYRNSQFRKKAFDEVLNKNNQIEQQSQILLEQQKLISKFQAQMNPHFFANSLNTLQGLIIENKQKDAIEQIQSIGMLMRQTIVNSDKEYINLSDEINYLKLYVKSIKNSIFPNLVFTVESKENDDLLILPMLIQPLLENSIKHGKLDLKSDPELLVSFSVIDNLMHIIICDNGCGFQVNSTIAQSHALHIINLMDITFNLIRAETDYLLIISV